MACTDRKTPSLYYRRMSLDTYPTSASDRVLACPELLSLIFDSFSVPDLLGDIPPDSSPSQISRLTNRAALASCARVCRRLSGHALDVLWHTLDDVMPLLHLFSSFTKVEVHYVSILPSGIIYIINEIPRCYVAGSTQTGLASNSMRLEFGVYGTGHKTQCMPRSGHSSPEGAMAMGCSRTYGSSMPWIYHSQTLLLSPSYLRPACAMYTLPLTTLQSLSPRQLFPRLHLLYSMSSST